MNSLNFFSLNTSDVLKKFNYWITTNSQFSVHFYKTKNLISFKGNIVFGADLLSSSIIMDLVNSKPFTWVLVSKDKVFFEKDKPDISIMSNFDKVILIENFKFSYKFKKYFLEIKDLENSQTLLEKLSEFTLGKKISIICKRKFYFFHEVIFIPARTQNIENYLSFIFKKTVDFSEDDIWRTKTILYELFDNALEHGSKFNENKIIRIETIISNNGINIIISDQGEGFNMSNIDFSLDKNKVTGRGIMMVKMLSDILLITDKGRTTNVFINRSNSQYIPFFV